MVVTIYITTNKGGYFISAPSYGLGIYQVTIEDMAFLCAIGYTINLIQQGG